MTNRLNRKTWLVLASVVLFLTAGIVYAVTQISRDISGTFVVARIQTADEALLLFSQIAPSSGDLTELNFGSGDVTALGFFVTPARIPFWAGNGDVVPFKLGHVPSSGVRVRHPVDVV